VIPKLFSLNTAVPCISLQSLACKQFSIKIINQKALSPFSILLFTKDQRNKSSTIKLELNSVLYKKKKKKKKKTLFFFFFFGGG